ncbi:glycosyl hydrolases family 16-domain-containing protein [Jimgerdemannia flammicorona]|uniref:Glycosyl hydrolases family 16-domain-containing protein n=1 Tax=Jimgerdemannia flammicorona TaxID=994334 RepID=A0A433QJ90_9FUNG|nr:glycosyl hydrolases family 16-domain-containing protein [Jimgerdemannia flammicorona]
MKFPRLPLLLTFASLLVLARADEDHHHDDATTTAAVDTAPTPTGTGPSGTCTPWTVDFSKIADGTSPLTLGFYDAWCAKNTYIQGGHLILKLDHDCGPNLASKLQFQEGRVDVTIKTAYSSGVVTAYSLLSTGTVNRDEIDLEWVGIDPDHVQTMYFVKGARVKGAEDALLFDIGGDTSQAEHTYSVEYKSDSITWFIDNTEKRVVKAAESSPYLTEPLQLHLGVWDASVEAPDWAGKIDWTKSVNNTFLAYVSKVSITPYSCVNYNEVIPATNSKVEVGNPGSSVPAASATPALKARDYDTVPVPVPALKRSPVEGAAPLEKRSAAAAALSPVGLVVALAAVALAMVQL